MKLNLKGWKKVHEETSHSVLTNKDGHSLTIAHSTLHPATRGQLAALPMSAPVQKLAKGGAVKDDTTDLADPMMSDDPQGAMAASALRQGIAQAGDSPAVKQALDVTSNLSNFEQMAQAAKNGDPQAQDQLAQHNAGIAMGTVKGEGILPPSSTAAPGAALKEAQALQSGANTAKTMQASTERVGREMARPQGFRPKRPPSQFADGGEVTDEQQPLAINTQMPAMPADLMNPSPGSQAIPDATPQVTEMSPQAAAQSNQGALPYGVSPEAATPQAAPQPAQASQQQMQGAQASQTPPTASTQADPYGNNAYQDAYMKGLNSEKAGLVQEAQAADTQGKAQAEILGKQQAIQAQQATEYQTHYQALDAERNALMKDIQDQHIDPNHFVNTMDGASKIATAMGLIASGIGSGMSHQENMASKFLSQQIDNDIQAQKANLGTKENLLSANMRQFGNMRDAMDMTRVMQSDIMANQLKMEAAKQAGPMAKANLLKAAGELEMKSAPVLSQIAMRKTLMSGMANGRVAPEAVIRMVVPEHEQAGATKELKEAQNAYKAKDNVLSAFDQVAKINTVGGNMTAPIQTRRQVAALAQPVIASLSKETAGRFTEQDAHMLQTLFPAMGDNADTAMSKRGQIVKLITEKLNFPELKKWGIDLSNTGRYDNTGKSRITEGKPKR